MGNSKSYYSSNKLLMYNNTANGLEVRMPDLLLPTYDLHILKMATRPKRFSSRNRVHEYYFGWCGISYRSEEVGYRKKRRCNDQPQSAEHDDDFGAREELERKSDFDEREPSETAGF
jgi:hypothetical protein